MYNDNVILNTHTEYITNINKCLLQLNSSQNRFIESNDSLLLNTIHISKYPV